MNFNSSYDGWCNSARMVAEAAQREQEIQKAALAHRTKLEAGAEASMEQRQLLEQQVDLLKTQNGKLRELYEKQVADGKVAQQELKKSWRFNAWMMVIAIISMLAAIASLIISVI